MVSMKASGDHAAAALKLNFNKLKRIYAALSDSPNCSADMITPRKIYSSERRARKLEYVKTYRF
jgi:hypothetical protein